MPPTYNANAAPPSSYGAPEALPAYPPVAPPPGGSPASGAPSNGRPDDQPDLSRPPIWLRDDNETAPIPTAASAGWGRNRADQPPAAPPAARPASARILTLGDLLAVVGGLGVFLFSMLPFVAYNDARLATEAARDGLDTAWSAWSAQTFLAPLTWVLILSALSVAALSGVRALGRSPRAALGFTIQQVQTVLAGFVSLVLLCYAVSEKTVVFGTDRPRLNAARVQVDTTLALASGGYLMLLGAILMTIGAVLILIRSGGPTVWPFPSGAGGLLAKRFGSGSGAGGGGRPAPHQYADSAPPYPNQPGSAAPQTGSYPGQVGPYRSQPGPFGDHGGQGDQPGPFGAPPGPFGGQPDGGQRPGGYPTGPASSPAPGLPGGYGSAGPGAPDQRPPY